MGYYWGPGSGADTVQSEFEQFARDLNTYAQSEKVTGKPSTYKRLSQNKDGVAVYKASKHSRIIMTLDAVNGLAHICVENDNGMSGEVYTYTIGKTTMDRIKEVHLAYEAAVNSGLL